MQACEARLLAALQGENRGRPPLWIMRQAGRYLPEYRQLRTRYPLRDLFFTPELAAQVTHMPIERFGFDAAILFSDIAVVALALGLKLDFSEGPVISPEVTPAILEQLTCDLAPLEPVEKTIRILKTDLLVPLLGFCGAPFTVASYLIGSLDKTVAWMRSDEGSFGRLSKAIEIVSIAYLKRQVAAGVDAVQIFDSWANVLTAEEFQKWTLPFLKRCISALEVPVIFFMRGAAAHLEEIPCAISLDSAIPMAEARGRTRQPLQGNIDPNLLFSPMEEIDKSVKALLASMHGDPSFIVNLGHGIKPGTPLEAVERLVHLVHTA